METIVIKTPTKSIESTDRPIWHHKLLSGMNHSHPDFRFGIDNRIRELSSRLGSWRF